MKIVKLKKEGKLTGIIREDILKLGGYIVNYWVGGEFTEAGNPDLFGCYRAWYLGIEAKLAYNEEPTPLQMKKLSLINKNGGAGFVVHDKYHWDIILPNLMRLNHKDFFFHSMIAKDEVAYYGKGSIGSPIFKDLKNNIYVIVLPTGIVHGAIHMHLKGASKFDTL